MLSSMRAHFWLQNKIRNYIVITRRSDRRPQSYTFHATKGFSDDSDTTQLEKMVLIAMCSRVMNVSCCLGRFTLS